MNKDPLLLSRWIKVLLTISLLVLLSSGAWFYRLQGQAMQKEVEKDLIAIAHLQFERIIAWQKDQLKHAALPGQLHLPDQVARFIVKPSALQRQDLLRSLSSIALENDYTDIFLVSPNGKYLISLSGQTHHHIGFESGLVSALHEGKPTLVDLHREAPDRPPHVSVLAPIFSNNRLLGALVLITNASEVLYPVIQSWPTPSKTAETLLVRRDDDDVIFLNNLRHQPDAALNLKIPIHQSEVPAVMAVQGKEGFVRGKDYRGVEVAAVIRPIAGTKWFMVAKIDAAEVYSQWRFQSVLILSLVLGSIVLVVVMGLVPLQWAKKVHFQTLYHAEVALRVSKERHSIILRAIGDAVIATDAQGRVEMLNPVAEIMTGWEQAKAKGRALEEVFSIVSARTREKVENPVSKVLQKGSIIGLAKHTILIAKDGTEYQIADSVAPIKDQDGAVTGVVLVFRDVTQEYRMQAELKLRETRYRELVESTASISWEYDIVNDRWTFVSPQVETILGWVPEEWTNLAFWVDHLHADDRETAYNHCITCTEKGENHSLEYRFRSKNGEYVWLRDVANIELEDSRPVKMRGVMIDITDRKQSEEALRRSERYYRGLIQSLHEDILVIDRDFRVTDINNNALQTLGVKREDAIGRYCYELSHGLNSPCYEHPGACEKCGLLHVFNRGDICSMQHQHIDGKGRRHHIDLLCSPLIDDNGQVTHMVEAARDVTQLFSAQKAVIQSEEKYRALYGNAPLPYQSLDGKGCFLDVNPAWIETLGYAKKDILGRPFEDILHPDFQPNFKELFTMFKQRGQCKGVEFKLRRQDGSYIDASFTGRNGYDEEGRFLQTYCVFEDISIRKQVEENLRRLMSAIEHTTEAIIITDIEGEIQYVNPAFEQVSGYCASEVIGQNPRFLKSGEQDEAFYHDLWQSILNGETWRGRMTNRRKDGTFYVEEAVISPVLNDAGVGTNFVAVKRDITSEIRMEEKLHQAQKMEAIGTLAGGIAHDFNNILFPIIGMSELMLEDYQPGSPEYENIEEIYRAGKRASELVKQILAFSRQSSGKKLPSRIQQIIKEVIKLIRSTIPSNISISYQVQPDCGFVMADPVQIHQIAMNLITNAYHALENDGGSISIHLKEIHLEGEALIGRQIAPGRYALLTVSDTGSGIDPSVRDKIFEPYFTTKAQDKGTGLGLSTVYGIVNQHKGDIIVYSEVGKGTTFNVYLPLMPRVDASESAESTQSLETGNERIFLVDDDAAIALIEKQMLERLGYQVTSRVSSLEALEAFKAAPEAYDLVISDMTMPGLTGTQLAMAMMVIRKDIPVIICTGFSEQIDPEKAEAMGINGFLMKPVVLGEMAQMVRTVLNSATNSNQTKENGAQSSKNESSPAQLHFSRR